MKLNDYDFGYLLGFVLGAVLEHFVPARTPESFWVGLLLVLATYVIIVGVLRRLTRRD